MSGQTNFHHQMTALLLGFSDIFTARLTVCSHSFSSVKEHDQKSSEALTGWEKGYIAPVKTKYYLPNLHSVIMQKTQEQEF